MSDRSTAIATLSIIVRLILALTFTSLPTGQASAQPPLTFENYAEGFAGNPRQVNGADGINKYLAEGCKGMVTKLPLNMDITEWKENDLMTQAFLEEPNAYLLRDLASEVTHYAWEVQKKILSGTRSGGSSWSPPLKPGLEIPDKFIEGDIIQGLLNGPAQLVKNFPDRVKDLDGMLRAVPDHENYKYLATTCGVILFRRYQPNSSCRVRMFKVTKRTLITTAIDQEQEVTKEFYPDTDKLWWIAMVFPKHTSLQAIAQGILLERLSDFFHSAANTLDGFRYLGDLFPFGSVVRIAVEQGYCNFFSRNFPGSCDAAKLWKEAGGGGGVVFDALVDGMPLVSQYVKLSKRSKILWYTGTAGAAIAAHLTQGTPPQNITFNDIGRMIILAIMAPDVLRVAKNAGEAVEDLKPLTELANDPPTFYEVVDDLSQNQRALEIAPYTHAQTKSFSVGADPLPPADLAKRFYIHNAGREFVEEFVAQQDVMNDALRAIAANNGSAKSQLDDLLDKVKRSSFAGGAEKFDFRPADDFLDSKRTDPIWANFFQFYDDILDSEKLRQRATDKINERLKLTDPEPPKLSEIELHNLAHEVAIQDFIKAIDKKFRELSDKGYATYIPTTNLRNIGSLYEARDVNFRELLQDLIAHDPSNPAQVAIKDQLLNALDFQKDIHDAAQYIKRAQDASASVGDTHVGQLVTIKTNPLEQVRVLPRAQDYPDFDYWLRTNFDPIGPRLPGPPPSNLTDLIEAQISELAQPGGPLYGPLKDEALHFFGNDAIDVINRSEIARSEFGVYLAMEKALPENLKGLAVQGHPARIAPALWKRIAALVNDTKGLFGSGSFEKFREHVSGQFLHGEKIIQPPKAFSENAFPKLKVGGHVTAVPYANEINMQSWFDHLFTAAYSKSKGYKPYKQKTGEELPEYLVGHFGVKLDDLKAMCGEFNSGAFVKYKAGCWNALISLALQNITTTSKGSRNILLPKELVERGAWEDMMKFAAGNIPRLYWQFRGYQAGVKTIFPESWSMLKIAMAAEYIKTPGNLVQGNADMGYYLGFYPPGDPNGLWIMVGNNRGVQTAFPAPNQ